MAESTTFRCYYDDGTILTAVDVCPLEYSGSPLIASELKIVEDVTGRMVGWPWILLILGLIVLTSSKERK